LPWRTFADLSRPEERSPLSQIWKLIRIDLIYRLKKSNEKRGVSDDKRNRNSAYLYDAYPTFLELHSVPTEKYSW